MKKLFILYITIVLFSSCTPKVDNTVNRKVEAKVDSVLSKLSLSEKLGQMIQVSSYYSTNPQKLKEQISFGLIGSLLNEVNPTVINELQKIAVESKNGIPLIIGRDVIHGFRTIFPIPLGQAASWNPDLIERSAHIAAMEARSVGVTWTFAPMIDIARDSRWGRVAEGYGEDPYLTSLLGSAAIKGYQGNNISSTDRMAACAKHFAAYGAVEAGRDYNSVSVSDQDLRNVYLSPFKSAVDAGVATLMTSFNEVNGIPSSGNRQLITDLLREEWGFNGFVVSDWTSILEMIDHGFAADESQCAQIAANAGVDMEMSSHTYTDYLSELTQKGQVSMETIDNMVRNILRVKFQLGLFDHPYVDVLKKTVMAEDSSLTLAKRMAEESLVLLKNTNSILPLNLNLGKVAIVGPMADDRYEQLGTWIFDGDTTMTITPLKAIKSLIGEDRVLYRKTLTHSRDNSISRFGEAKSIASSADAILVFIGEESILAGEAHGRANIDLPGVQAELVKALYETGKPIIAVIMAGRPLSIKNILPYTHAILYAWHPGTMGGPAIADVLFGKVNPSGKLPITIPKSGGQCPIYYSKKNTGRPADYNNWVPIDKISVRAPQTSLGNTSHHLDDGFDPLFSFGFGLSYTTFEYSNIQLSSPIMTNSGSIEVTVSIANTGNLGGYEIAQLYIHDKVGSITRPIKELKGFQKVWLNAGETKELTFSLNASDLAFYKSWSERVIEPGEFEVFVGGDSNARLIAQLKVE